MSEPRVSISQKELNTLRDSVQTLTAENEELKRKLERMNELLLNAQRARFGQSSEKRDYVMPNQLGLFNEAEAEQNAKEEEPTEETFTVKEHKRKKKRTRTTSCCASWRSSSPCCGRGATIRGPGGSTPTSRR